jgi:hypothetical protein
MRKPNLLAPLFTLLACSFVSGPAASDPLPEWPQLFEPTLVADLNVKVRSGDWNTIINDESFDIEVPALFWASQDGDESSGVLVSIRRKSATPINGKVSFKIDINEYNGLDARAVSKWKGIKKLSLENGDDQDVVTEGLSWALHRLASQHGVYAPEHKAGMANWVNLTLHQSSCGSSCGEYELGETQKIEPLGIYLHVEHVDKQFLKNRNLWTKDETWLYMQDDIGPSELKEAGCEPENPVSPTVAALQCSPFAAPSGKGRNKVVPSDCSPEALDLHIDMDVMLGLGAVNNFTVNPDELFTKEKNYFWADFSLPGCTQAGNKRVYFPWDLDAAISKSDSDAYGSKKRGGGKNKESNEQLTEMQRVILGDESAGGFRERYNWKMAALSSPAFIADAKAFLDIIEPVLTPHLIADPNSKMSENPAGHFSQLRGWLEDRAQNVSNQLCQDDPKFCQ